MRRVLLLFVLLCSFLFAAPDADLVEFLVPGSHKSNTRVNAYGTVTFWESSAKTSYKTVWSDANKVTSLTNPVTLDAYGSAIVYADGNYYVELKDSSGTVIDGFTAYYATNVDFGGLYVDVLNSYGNTNSLIDSAITDYTGSSNVIFLWLNDTYSMTSNKSFPSNIDHLLLPDAVWDISAGSTVRVSGEVKIWQGADIQNDGTLYFGEHINAGSYQFLSGTGGEIFITENIPVKYDDWDGGSDGSIQLLDVSTANIDGGHLDDVQIGQTTQGKGDFSSIGSTSMGTGYFTEVGINTTNVYSNTMHLNEVTGSCELSMRVNSGKADWRTIDHLLDGGSGLTQNYTIRMLNDAQDSVQQTFISFDGDTGDTALFGDLNVENITAEVISCDSIATDSKEAIKFDVLSTTFAASNSLGTITIAHGKSTSIRQVGNPYFAFSTATNPPENMAVYADPTNIKIRWQTGGGNLGGASETVYIGVWYI